MVPLPAEGEPSSALQEYTDRTNKFLLRVPADWDAKDKAGAVVLFEDPSRRSTSIGITVNPVKVSRIEDFGGVKDVGEKLLDAERRKDGFLSASLVSESSHSGAAGATLYEYEYELESTRGRKRILNTVTIFNSRLYILNGAYKCDKEGCTPEALGSVQRLRDIAATFDVLSS